jgi:hypothetical protein
MATTRKIYWRTREGLDALRIQDPAVPVEMRNILALLVDELRPGAIRARLRRYSDAEIDGWLDRLESLHLLASKPDPSETGIDLTGSFFAANFLDRRAA